MHRQTSGLSPTHKKQGKKICINICLPLTNDERCMCEIKSRIAMPKAAFNKKKKTLFTSKLDLNLRKKLVKCYIWSMALYGAET